LVLITSRIFQLESEPETKEDSTKEVLEEIIKELSVEEVKEEKTLTDEEKKHKELLAKRLEELRKRDPFIYK
jgi:hypothetical protein